MRVQFDDFTVEVDSYYSHHTYGGMLEGVPTKEDNRRTMKRAEGRLQKLWGERNIWVLNPEVTPAKDKFPHRLPEHMSEAVTKGEYLPPIECMAWLRSYRPVKDENACGSHAFVIWYQTKEMMDEPIAEQIQAAFDGFKWSQIAEDFDV